MIGKFLSYASGAGSIMADIEPLHRAKRGSAPKA
jgi:hypothetical protein